MCSPWFEKQSYRLHKQLFRTVVLCQPFLDFQLSAYKSGGQANMDPEAKSQDSELEQQPTLGDDLLCYITAITRLPPPTAPIENAAVLRLTLLRRDRLHPPPQIEGQKKITEQKANPPISPLAPVLIKQAAGPSQTGVKPINNAISLNTHGRNSGYQSIHRNTLNKHVDRHVHPSSHNT